LRALNPDVLSKNAEVLPSRPVLKKAKAWIMEFSGDAEYSGPNPPDGAMINYYLKKRHIFGTLKLEVYDGKGKLIKILPTTKHKGINRIYWDMRLKPPKVAPSPSLSAGILVGPMLPKGTYKVKLIKGKETYEGKIDVKDYPLQKYSKEEREIRHKAIMELYRMQERLAYIVDTINELVKQSEEKKEKSGKKLKKELAAFLKELKDFRCQLISGGMLQADRLREKVIGLYRSILSYGGKPTDAQLRYFKWLGEEMKKEGGKFKNIINRKVPAMNLKLKRKRIKPLHILSFEEYKKKEEK